MGKYMRKAKTAGDVAVMDVSQSSLGVRTRAKTLALQKSAPTNNGGLYLQLRSRRLERPPIPVNESSWRTKARGRDHSGEKKENSKAEKVEVKEENSKEDLGIEASFGENFLDFEKRESCDRSTRESTPSSLIRDPETIRTPGSTTRHTSSRKNNGVENSMQTQIPTTQEMDQFFSGPEEEQQRQFTEKYNYDPVNDKPLPGRFQWEKVEDIRS